MHACYSEHIQCFRRRRNDEEDEDLPPLVPNDWHDLPPLLPYRTLPDDDLPPLVPSTFEPNAWHDLPPLVPIGGRGHKVRQDLPLAKLPDKLPDKLPEMSYKNIIQITREQVLKEEQDRWELEKRKEEEKKRKELARKMEENRKIVEAFKTAPKQVFKPLNWADDSDDE